MSCGNKFGNLRGVSIGLETTYGTLSTSMMNTNFKANGEKTRAVIESTSQMRDTKQNQVNFIPGNEGGTFEITGDIDASPAMRMLFELSLGSKVTRPETFDEEYVISKKDIKSFSIQVKDVDTRDDYLGCVIQNLKISGSSGGMVTLTATGRCKIINKNISDTSAIRGYESYPKMDFSQITLTLENGATTITAFSFTLDNTLVPDEVSYRNSPTRVCDGKVSTNAQLELTVLAGDGNDDVIFNTLADSNTLRGDRLTMSSGSIVLTFETFGFYTTANETDDETILLTFNKTLVDSVDESAVGLLIGYEE